MVDLIVTFLNHPVAATQTYVESDGEDMLSTQLLQHMGNAARNVFLI